MKLTKQNIESITTLAFILGPVVLEVGQKAANSVKAKIQKHKQEKEIEKFNEEVDEAYKELCKLMEEQ